MAVRKQESPLNTGSLTMLPASARMQWDLQEPWEQAMDGAFCNWRESGVTQEQLPLFNSPDGIPTTDGPEEGQKLVQPYELHAIMLRPSATTEQIQAFGRAWPFAMPCMGDVTAWARYQFLRFPRLPVIVLCQPVQQPGSDELWYPSILYTGERGTPHHRFSLVQPQRDGTWPENSIILVRMGVSIREAVGPFA